MQLQLLAAFMIDPAFRPDALEHVKAALPSAFGSAQMSPGGVFQLKASGDPYDGDSRFSTPSQVDAMAVSNEQVTAMLKNQLGHGPVDITIVGDVTVDEAVRQIGANLGALPRLPAAVAVPGGDQLHFSASGLHRVYRHDGRADQNLSFIAWPTTDYYSDPPRSAALDVLATVLTLRELDDVREKQGASYSASAPSNTARYFPGFGFIASRAGVRPDMDDSYYRTVSAIVEGLKQQPVTADELTRARLPMIDHLHADRNSNAYWLSLLSGTVRDPQQIASARQREADLLSVTPAQLEVLAKIYLDMSKLAGSGQTQDGGMTLLPAPIAIGRNTRSR